MENRDLFTPVKLLAKEQFAKDRLQSVTNMAGLEHGSGGSGGFLRIFKRSAPISSIRQIRVSIMSKVLYYLGLKKNNFAHPFHFVLFP
ncbi:MAG: hypothetical protein H6577_04060 [Lewinellaceae bacterium]|nr:hypothetical protein [Saprospiraceae bacterium]MCB9337279.1 hypothetical protein [Lewinellaceae bacterium]